MVRKVFMLAGSFLLASMVVAAVPGSSEFAQGQHHRPSLSGARTEPLFLTCLADANAGMALAAARPPASAETTALSKADVAALLQTHNRYRAEVGVPPLAWSDDLARYAQQWAERLADRGCRMAHRPASGPWQQQYGENLYTGTLGHYGMADAVQLWHSEKKYYDGQPLTQRNYQAVGHFTQLVWHSTRELGCGVAQCQGRMMLVCNYHPAGNILGQKPY